MTRLVEGSYNVPPLPSTAKDMPSAFFACMGCRKRFRSLGGQGAHMFKSHGHVDPCRYLSDLSSCPACLKEYFTHAKLKAHLRSSSSCRQLLWGRRARVTPAPGTGSVADSALAIAHGGLCPVQQGLGPLPQPVQPRDIDPVDYDLHTKISELLLEGLGLHELRPAFLALCGDLPVSWTTLQATLQQVARDYGAAEADITGYAEADLQAFFATARVLASPLC